MTKFLGRVEFPCTIELGRGLEGAITNLTQVGFVNGEDGTLIYRGYSIEDLCAYSNYEEVAYLLIYGKLPTRAELKGFQDKLREHGELSRPILDIIKAQPRDAHPMNVLQSAVAAMAGFDKDSQAVTEHLSDPGKGLKTETEVALRILAQVRSVGAAIARIQAGKDILQPRGDLNFTENYLYMMSGEKPDEVTARVMDVCLIIQADHGMNASTFTAMVVHSCLSDMYSTVAAAVGALRGPLHGGANESSLEDLQSIGSPEKAPEWVRQRLAAKQKIIGFGHRVYKAYDPRAKVLRGWAEKMCKQKGLQSLFETAEVVDREVCAAMKKAGKPIFPNVDFYSGLVYHALGIPAPLYPVIFAVSRTAGWVSRVLEYLPENRIFRPRAVYTGPTDLVYTPIEKR